MSRASNRKKTRDQQRAERITRMEADEAALRDSLDSLFRKGKELGAWAHYDRLFKEKCAVVTTLGEEIGRALTNDSLELLGQCGTQNYTLSKECERLRRQLDALEGRPPRPSPLDNLDLSSLSLQEADSIRFVMELDALPRSPAEVAEALQGRALQALSTHLQEVSAKWTRIQQAVNQSWQIGEAKVKHGQLPPAALESARSQVVPHMAALESAIAKRQQFLEKETHRHAELVKEHENLTRRLTGQ